MAGSGVEPFDNLKPRWPRLPGSIRRQCDRMARLGSAGNFALLEMCDQGEEGERLEGERPRVLAIVENRDTLPLSSKKAQRAINQIDGIAFYRDDESATLQRTERVTELPRAA